MEKPRTLFVEEVYADAGTSLLSFKLLRARMTRSTCSTTFGEALFDTKASFSGSTNVNNHLLLSYSHYQQKFAENVEI